MTEKDANADRGQWLLRMGRLYNRLRLGRIFGIALPVLAVASAAATYFALTDAGPLGANQRSLNLLLYADLVLLLGLAFVVVRRIVKLGLARRRGSAGSRLHIRLSVLFGLMAITPTILVLLFSILFFVNGMQSWFGDRIINLVETAKAVADGYLAEHQENIKIDALRIARDLNRDGPLLESNPRLLHQAVNLQAQLRGLSESIVFDGTGRVMARSGFTLALENEPIDKTYLEAARSGEVPIFQNETGDRVRALVRLDNFLDAYLFVGRIVDPTVLSYTQQTGEAVDEFQTLKDSSQEIIIFVTLMFLLVALLMMTAAVWLGLNVATDLSRPVGELIGAVEKVREGDLSARVRELPPDDEIGILSRAFNRMTHQLSDQRRELVQTNQQLDERRRFTEMVLSGVSAGVIGLDRKGNITLPNLSAARLLGLETEDMVGKPLSTITPEIGALLPEARKRRSKPIEAQVKITRNNEVRTLMVAVAVEELKGKTVGYVVTFDDVSVLLDAQWKGAWADVARRIAHEIRNPLTPIQLSAERLKRKYLKEIKSDKETFVICTDTIVRQVDDIGRMIEEFSNFARMPAPVLRLDNLNELCRQVMFLQRNAYPDIDFIAVMPEEPLYATCDGRQMGQVVTNLVQNAAESMERRDAREGTPRVILRLRENDGRAVIEVEDNGPGLPLEGRDKLVEPYVTTRKKGTGLGLAIARKILEDHGGCLILGDAEGGGALIRAEIPRDAGPADERRRQTMNMEVPVSHGS
ncbi:MAG: PAS domain-containing sensor histidine kinase [Alphaproteobacteria bacterium]|jgi:two-component system nitrogen regulation sensor histidine kinase NtrY|nr:PAS domain-containing sensor histidine kinase [Alphaproteobacteria bacterium]